MIRAGRLNRQIVIQALVQTKDSHGGLLDSWIPFASARAAVNHLSGKEKRLSSKDGQITEAVSEFTMRYKAGVNTTMRLLYDGKVYNIKHANDLNGARRLLIITCDTGLNDGR